MSAPQLIHNTPNFVFWELPLGKPDPNAVCSPEILENDTRPRVLQAANKKHTCWYSSFKTIRPQFGKHPTPELSNKRKIEQRCSLWRKTITEHALSLPIIFEEMLMPEIEELWCSWNHKKVTQMLSDERSYYERAFSSKQVGKGGPSAFPYLEKFLKQTDCKNFHEYVGYMWLQPRFKINTNLLQSFNVDPENILEKYHKGNAQASINSSQLSFDKNDSLFLENFVKWFMSQLFELKESSWSPSEPINHLILELKNRGPLVVGGNFGTDSYSSDPFIMKENVAERSIYAWPPGTKHKDIRFGHTITIIGARKYGDKGLVYYVDPMDPSDPNDITAQKIYAISYQSLKDNAITFLGRKEPSMKDTNSVFNKYALAAPKPPKCVRKE